MSAVENGEGRRCSTSDDPNLSPRNLPRPAAEVNLVEAFLKNLGGPWHLATSRNWAGRTFTDLDEAVTAVCRSNDAGNCCYFLANTPRRGRLPGRSRKKSDIAHMCAVFLDIDDPDPEVRDELVSRLDWPPTYVAFKGGGWQAMWRLSEHLPTADGECIAVWLQNLFEDLTPDSTHSCEHIFRLPGTRNRKAARHDRLVELHHEAWDAVLPVREAGRLEVSHRRRGAPMDLAPRQLPEWADATDFIPPWARRLLDDPTDKDGRPFPSRNEHEYAFVGACLRDGVDPEILAAILMEPVGLGETHRVQHRTHWAKVKGSYVARRSPQAHASRQVSEHEEMADE